jgi:4-oxocyclohex-2-ene-1-carboxylate desaturase
MPSSRRYRRSGHAEPRCTSASATALSSMTTTRRSPVPESLGTYDVVVVGSGAAGLATALSAHDVGLGVIVLEKDEQLGGTSAVSGGWLWVPGNRQGVAEGDTRAEVEQYLRALAGPSLDETRLSHFLNGVPEAVDFFERRTRMEFEYPPSAPDYQMEIPGAKKSGRALTVVRADSRMLGADRLRVRPYLYTYTVFGYMPEVGPDIAMFLKANRSVKAFAYVARRLLVTWLQRVLFGRAFTRTNGNALMTRLIASARDRGIPLVTGARVVGLRHGVDGVDGVEVKGTVNGHYRASRSVVLAAGGFSGDPDLRDRYFPHATGARNHHTPTVGHAGDSISLAEEVDGVVDNSPCQPAAWGPVTVWRSLRGRARIFPHLRAFGLPGLICVNRHGERFANESLSYHDFGVALIEDNKDEPDVFGWIIADSTAMRRYGIGYAKPWPLPTWYYRKVGYLVRGRNVPELASKIGAPVSALERTLRRFNADARRGVDDQLGRGSTWFHHFKGDMEHRPNPNLAPIERAPFYAVKIEMGDLGTYAGLRVDDQSRVLTTAGEPVGGLRAVGSAAVSVFGGGYPGYGANIGPAMVFGYLIGRQLAEESAGIAAVEPRRDVAATTRIAPGTES